MAKKTPFLNIDRLRAETGSEQIIPESSFDQYEPATSYNLGTSMLAVNMTPADWPLTGIGVVDTNRADDDYAVQNFQPNGISLTYRRRWDTSPLDFSDDFDGTNGTSYNTDKWVESANFTGTADIQGNKLRLSAGQEHSGLISKYQLRSDFDIEIFLDHRFPVGGAGIVLGSKVDLDAGLGWGDFNNDLIGVEAADGNWQAYGYGSQNDGQSTLATDEDRYWRITRVGTQFTWYHKTLVGDAWSQIRSVDNGTTIGNADLYLKLYTVQSLSVDVFFDDYVINSGTVLPDEASSAHWSDWIEYKDAATIETENQTYADGAITTHESAGHGTTSGSFTTNDGKTVTVTNGIITNIV